MFVSCFRLIELHNSKRETRDWESIPAEPLTFSVTLPRQAYLLFSPGKDQQSRPDDHYGTPEYPLHDVAFSEHLVAQKHVDY